MNFFFQAEDGIRDVERSRGLGDVYKRQILVYLKEIESHQRAKEHAIISQEIDLDERI